MLVCAGRARERRGADVRVGEIQLAVAAEGAAGAYGSHQDCRSNPSAHIGGYGRDPMNRQSPPPPGGAATNTHSPGVFTAVTWQQPATPLPTLGERAVMNQN